MKKNYYTFNLQASFDGSAGGFWVFLNGFRDECAKRGVGRWDSLGVTYTWEILTKWTPPSEDPDILNYVWGHELVTSVNALLAEGRNLTTQFI